MSSFIVIYIQQNLARRHEPSACLDRVLDELEPFTFLKRSISYLQNKLQSTAFPEVLQYLRRFVDKRGFLPRIVPIACIQEPNLQHGKPTGFSNKQILCTDDPRAAVVTLKGIDIALIGSLSHRDCAWVILSNKNKKQAICSFYSDINERSLNVNVDQTIGTYQNVILLGDSNAHSTLWGSPSNNIRGDSWEEYIFNNNLYLFNDTSDPNPTFCNHLGSSKIDITLSNSSDALSNWHNTSTFHGSDHSIILVTGDFTPFVDRKQVQNINKTDWVAFVDNLPALGSYNVSNTSQLNQRALLVINNIKKAFDIACPPIKSFPGKPSKWWTSELTHLLRKKKLAGKTARRYRGTQRGVRASLAKNSLGKLFQKHLRIGKSESWKKFTSNLTGYKNISTLFKSMKHGTAQSHPFTEKAKHSR